MKAEIFFSIIGFIISLIIFVWFYNTMNHMNKMLTEINYKIPKTSIQKLNNSHFKVDSTGVKWVQ